MNNIIERARKFAIKKHQNQTRKFEKTPYMNHPIEVAKLVQSEVNDVDMIAAAYLHDTIEDTDTSFEEINEIFNDKIANFVKELTSDKEQQKRQGKPLYLANKINNMSYGARIIKFADRLHNVSDLSQGPLEFQLRYALETEYILTHLNFQPTITEKKFIKKIFEKIKPYLPQK